MNMTQGNKTQNDWTEQMLGLITHSLNKHPGKGSKEQVLVSKSLNEIYRLLMDMKID